MSYAISGGRRTVVRGRVLADNGWMDGRITIAGVRISVVDGEMLPASERPEPPYLLPGFVDLHVHGGGGHDTMDGEAAVRGMARFHAEHGTAALAPTTMTAPADEIAAALGGIAAVRASQQAGGALVLGAHLEGPFINPDKLGAQPPHTIAPDVGLAREWVGICPIAVATIAPELPGAEALIAYLLETGCRVQIGHSTAACGVAEAALRAGAAGFTHLFNAMSGLDHREPGVAAASLSVGRHAEIITDLIHVAPAMIRAAIRAIPELYAVTDATAAAGMADGPSRIGGVDVVKAGDRVTLPDSDTLAGSALTMDQALRNLVGLGMPLARAAAMVATRPAGYIGRDDLGRLVPGARASIVQLDEDLTVRRIWIEGQAI